MANKKINYICIREFRHLCKQMDILLMHKRTNQEIAEAFDYDIVGEYEDVGKSGKSIEGRAEFKKMMEDIESNRGGVSYILIFKLSRFGHNAADVLGSLQLM